MDVPTGSGFGWRFTQICVHAFIEIYFNTLNIKLILAPYFFHILVANPGVVDPDQDTTLEKSGPGSESDLEEKTRIRPSRSGSGSDSRKKNVSGLIFFSDIKVDIIDIISAYLRIRVEFTRIRP